MVIKKRTPKSVIKPMSKEQLNKSTKAIRKSNSEMQIEVTKLALCEGWKAKEHSNFKNYCEIELPDINYHTLNNHRRIGEILYNVGGEDAVGKYKGDAIKQMFKLSTKQQKQVWVKLQKCYGHEEIPTEWLTKKVVVRAMEALGFIESDLSSDSVDESEEKDSSKQSGKQRAKESRLESGFIEMLEDENLDRKFLSRHIAELVQLKVNQKNKVRMCKVILKGLSDPQLTKQLDKLLCSL